MLVFRVSETLLTDAPDPTAFLVSFLFSRQRIRSEDAIRHALEATGLSSDSGNDFLAPGRDWSSARRQMTRGMLCLLGLEPDAGLFVRQIEEIVCNHTPWAHTTGAVAALELLRREGWVLGGDVTGQPAVEQAVHDTGLSDYFGWIDIFQQKDDFRDARCWYVGNDSKRDSKTAQRAGLRFALVESASRESNSARTADVCAARVDLAVKSILDIEGNRV